MKSDTTPTFSAFLNHDLFAEGTLKDIAQAIKDRIKGAAICPLVFSDLTGAQIDLNLSGSRDEVLQRYESKGLDAESSSEPVGRGRPKLGVVSKEITLLPRHWDWLAAQQGGASATLRRLIEKARKDSGASDKVRNSQDAAYKFMMAVAGNLENYEEALRALYSGLSQQFQELIKVWPKDIQNYVLKLATPSFIAK